MQVTQSQQKAITHRNGPAMVLAGPGSGKTLVITQRVRFLITECGVDPSHILVITFTRAAAGEMRQRFQALCARQGVTFGTFHAVFFQILRHAYHYTSGQILTEEERFQIIRPLIAQMKIPAEDEQELLNDLAAEISLIKNEGVALEHYYPRSCPQEQFQAVFSQYEQIHRGQGKLDYDDMLVYTRELLAERADILESWQRRFPYILVDEFQDINAIQYEITRMLALPGNNLFVVGDDDQSIYRFRGAKPEIMLNFPRSYPDAKVIRLEENFRSSPQIVRAACLVIEENKKRFEKTIRAVCENGPEPMIQEVGDQEEEGMYLCRQIRRMTEKGIPLREIAVLVRTNLNARPYAERLMEFNLPFIMRDALPNIYEHWMAKDFFAYFTLAREGMKREAFLRVMNRPKRYFSRDAVNGDPVRMDLLRLHYKADKAWMEERVDQFETELRVIGRLRPFAAINYIRKGVGYDDFLQEYAAYRRIRPQELLNMADELQESAHPWNSYEEWMAHIRDFTDQLENRKKQEDRRRKEDPSIQDALTLSTLHGCKGLEFDHVFLMDVNEGILPHQKALSEADLEEERRLFYVGMTRARKTLHILSVKSRYGRTCDSSRFLEPLFGTEPGI